MNTTVFSIEGTASAFLLKNLLTGVVIFLSCTDMMGSVEINQDQSMRTSKSIHSELAISKPLSLLFVRDLKLGRRGGNLYKRKRRFWVCLDWRLLTWGAGEL